MMLPTVRQNYKLPLFLGIGISVVAVLFSALFNKFSDQLSPFINMMPAGMKAVVGDLAIGTTPEGWLSIELFPLVAMVGVVIVAIILGAGMIGREEDSGTLELLLASRRTRVTIVLQKYVAMAGLLVIPPVMLCMTIALIGPLFDFHPNLTHVAGACVSLWLLGLSFGSLTFVTQAVTGRRGLAVGVGSLLFLAMYALSITAKLIESWKAYDVWSLIHYYNIPGSLMDGLDLGKLVVLIFVSLAALGVAAIGFYRRDTGV